MYNLYPHHFRKKGNHHSKSYSKQVTDQYFTVLNYINGHSFQNGKLSNSLRQYKIFKLIFFLLIEGKKMILLCLFNCLFNGYLPGIKNYPIYLIRSKLQVNCCPVTVYSSSILRGIISYLNS